ncbi:MAG: hypothetical protein AAFU61_18170, partial [Pseudomonadota bacterium]
MEAHKLCASDGAAGDRFGYAVALASGTAVVGAQRDDDAGAGSDSGSAYVFSFNGSAWAQTRKLVASDGAASDLFGFSVDVDAGGVAMVGAWLDDDLGSESGAVYVFSTSAPPPTAAPSLPPSAQPSYAPTPVPSAGTSLTSPSLAPQILHSALPSPAPSST